MAIEIKVPDIGSDEVEVTEILVKVGDKVEAEQSLITVEGDKASMEVPSPQAGVVKEIKISTGDKVETGSLIMVFDAEGAAEAAPAAAEEKKRTRRQRQPLLRPQPAKKWLCRISAVTKLKSLRFWLRLATKSKPSSH